MDNEVLGIKGGWKVDILHPAGKRRGFFEL